MFDLMKALNKIFGKQDKLNDTQPVPVARSGKHSSGKTRPHDFDVKRKTRRKMAKASRRINRKRL